MSDMNNYEEYEEIGFEDSDNIIGEVIHLILDDETEVDTLVVAQFELDDYPWTYVGLLPMSEDEDEEEEAEVLLYRFSTDEEGTPVLDNLESEEEYDAASEAFFAELDAMAEEEDEEE